MTDDDKRAETTGDTGGRSPETIPEAEIVSESAAEAIRPEPAAAVPLPAPERRRGGVIGPVIGGVLAAAAGFGLARAVPGGWPVRDTSALEAALAAQADQIASLKSGLAELAARPVPADPSQELATLRAGLEERLAETTAASDPSAAVAQATEGFNAAIAGLEARLTDVEKRPVSGAAGGAPATALAAYERELQSLKDQIATRGTSEADGLKAEIASAAEQAKAELAAATQEATRLKDEATGTARRARIDAALGRIEASLDSGGPYASAVEELSSDGLTVPPELASLAAGGIATLNDLQLRFPAAARDALDAALRTDMGATWGNRVGAFLRSQTGARSLEPREGNDPDAILSRAEAALDSGSIDTALAEVAALPEPAQAAMAGWVADASARLAAASAVAGLATAADTQ